MKVLDPTDIAWAAGFIEGEGCFSMNGRKARVTAQQNNREPLDRLQLLWGGSVCRQGTRGGTKNPSFVWTLWGIPLLRFIAAISPWLSEKKLGEATAVSEGRRPTREAVAT